MKGIDIKKAITERGLTITEVAAAIGKSQQTLSAALATDDVKTSLVEQIADYLGEPVSFFYAGEQPDTEPAEVFRVPLLPMEAQGGSLIDFEGSARDYECEQVVSPVKGASFAIQVAGDSMAPAFPNGSRILIQRVNEAAFIDWGRVYVLDTENGIIVKQIRKGSSPDRVLCCSLNPAPEYEPFEVETRYIRGWFRVLMLLTLV